MELQQNSSPVMEPQKSSKKWSWIIMLLVLVLAIAGAYYWVMAPTGDVSVDVQQDLESIDLGDLEAEMESLEMDLDQL
jgi:flagellar basal body-associated protein FliL